MGIVESLNSYCRENPFVVRISFFILNSIFAIVLFFLTTNIFGLKTEVLESLKVIRESTTRLSKCLDPNLNGGVDVVVGVNPKEIKENLAYVYSSDENPKLKLGEIIYLTNYSSNTYQTRLRFVVHKIVPKNGNATIATIFIGEDAAKRLEFSNYKTAGTIQLKMLRENMSEEKKSSVDSSVAAVPSAQ